MGILQRDMISSTPKGVAGSRADPGSPEQYRPIFRMWKPSTSFAGSTACITVFSSIWPGKGSWTRILSTSGSWLSWSIIASSLDWDRSAPSSMVVALSLHFSAALDLLETYALEAASLPTKMASRCGGLCVLAHV